MTLSIYEKSCYLTSHCVKINHRDYFRGEDLQEEHYEDIYRQRKISLKKRKRVNRIKMVIILFIIIMMIVPLIFNIILAIKVSQLQKNVNELMEMHGKYEQSIKSAKGKENYAYAAEMPPSNPADANDQDTNQHDDIDKTHKSNQSSLEKENEFQREEEIGEQEIEEQEIQEQEHLQSTETEIENFETEEEPTITETNHGIYEGKTVYLTFDDGPSIYTNEILDILADFNVKATFFVIGKTDKASKETYQRIVEEGHAIGLHSYSHDYRKIYNSLEDFEKDFTKLWDLLYDTIGYRPRIYRFPGGSANQVNPDGMQKFIQFLNDNDIVYFDWNVVNKDATGVEYTKDQLIDHVLSGVATKKRSIVLMHDSSTKGATVDSLSELIETLLSEGATILPLNEEVTPIQQIKANSYK